MKALVLVGITENLYSIHFLANLSTNFTSLMLTLSLRAQCERDLRTIYEERTISGENLYFSSLSELTRVHPERVNLPLVKYKNQKQSKVNTNALTATVRFRQLKCTDFSKSSLTSGSMEKSRGEINRTEPK